ncbi:major facilitator superfamily domain-containing protein [Aspergillus foveolatus]|uniref:major facilitator superfamily domain-containing protein n=1 Tax=Aspergillus foveolatus TaxID=210207 RepID=UPI003CCDC87C
MTAQPEPEKSDSALKTTGVLPDAVDVEKSVTTEQDAPPEESTSPGAKAGLSLAKFWIVMFWTNSHSLSVGMLLAALDFNIVATAVPIISSEFNAYNNSSWLGTGFLISFTLVLPLYSKLGDVFGRCNMFIFGTLVFILGSGLCVIQGIGGGGIYGLVNYVSVTWLVWAFADVAGPLLGGAFSESVTWRWCFYINLCISPISLIITFLYLRIPTPKIDKERIKNFDVIGTITLTGGTVCLLLAISWGGNSFPWSSSHVIGCFIGGFSLLLAFAIWEHYARDPLMPPVFFRNRAIVAILFAEFFYGANLLRMMYYVPQFFQLVYGDSATMSGVGVILTDVQRVKTLFGGRLYDSIIDLYAESLRNGWWWLFACAAALLASSACAKQRKVIGQ